MAFIEPIPEEDAEGATAELYAADLDEDGYVANSTKAFGHRPAVFAAWRQLGTTIGGSMDRRRYELATVAAARVLAPATARWPTARSWPSSSSAPSGRSPWRPAPSTPSTRSTPRSCGSRPW